MPADLTAPRRPRAARAPRDRRHQLITLVSRFLLAQAAADAVISLAYGRRHLPWLVAALTVAVAVCGLAAVVRSGSHPAWLAAVSSESALVAVGLFRFAGAGYLGGTLLAIVTLGILLHPEVSRVFSGAAGQRGIREGVAELQGSAAGS